jgi:hypothetical protein
MQLPRKFSKETRCPVSVPRHVSGPVLHERLSLIRHRNTADK